MTYFCSFYLLTKNYHDIQKLYYLNKTKFDGLRISYWQKEDIMYILNKKRFAMMEINVPILETKYAFLFLIEYVMVRTDISIKINFHGAKAARVFLIGVFAA